MFQVWIAAGDKALLSSVSKTLCEKGNCDVRTLNEDELHSKDNDFSARDLLIFDVESLGQQERSQLPAFCNSNQEANIVLFISKDKLSETDRYLQFGVDDIYIRPANEREMRRTIERLVQRISVCDHLFTLREKLRREMNQAQIVVKSRAMHEIMRRLPQLSAGTATVLINGETGTGKELIARAIHYLGPHSGHPFVTVDCGAIPDNLVENELFGHVAGAYTGAGQTFKGLIQEANGGTLFLDEVEALPIAIQTKFLRFLQERECKPIGQSKYISVNVRVLATTNIDLAKAVENKLFREDLYFRLNVVPLFLPPLRERKADIPALAHYFLERYSRDSQTKVEIPNETLRSWLTYHWPGNVRELENKVQEWLTFGPQDIWQDNAACYDVCSTGTRHLTDVRKEAIAICDCNYLQNLLTSTQGNLSAAARIAGIDRKNLRALLKKYGIDANRFRTITSS